MTSFTEAIAGRGELDKGIYLLQQTAGLAVDRRAYTVLEKSTLVAAWHCRSLGDNPCFALEKAASAGTQLLLLTAAPQILVPPQAGVPFAVTSSDGTALGHVFRIPNVNRPRIVLQPHDGAPERAVELGHRRGTLDGGGATIVVTPVKYGRGRNPADCLEIRVEVPLAPPTGALLFAGVFASRVWNKKAAVVPGGKAESQGGVWGALAEILGNLPS